jgi:hypothetical protein
MRAGCLPWANPAARAGSLLAEVTAHTRRAEEQFSVVQSQDFVYPFPVGARSRQQFLRLVVLMVVRAQPQGIVSPALARPSFVGLRHPEPPLESQPLRRRSGSAVESRTK